MALTKVTGSVLGDTDSADIDYTHSATGAVERTLQSKLGDTVSVKEFGAVGDWDGSTGTDDTAAIQAAIDYAESVGGSVISFDPSENYLHSGITLKVGVSLYGGQFNKNVNIFNGSTIYPAATLTYSETTGNAVTIPSNAYSASLKGFVLNCSAQTVSGVGVLFDDTAGILRSGARVQDCLIYKAKDHGILIDDDHKEIILDNVFVRGGDNSGDTVTNIGIENHSVDVIMNLVWCGFCVSRNIKENGGATRIYHSDFWGCSDINIEVTGTSGTFIRVQNDSAGGGGLLLNSCENYSFSEFVSLNNALSAASNDVTVQGLCRAISFTSPDMRGSSGSIGYAFSESDQNVVQISDGRFSSSYTAPMNPTAEAYYDWKQINHAQYPVRGSSRRIQLNDNINFADNAGTPTGWALRNSATTTRETSVLPLGHATAVSITSAASATTGIQVDLTADIAKYKGMRIRVRGLFRGDGTASTGDQQIQIFTNVSTTSENIANDATYHAVAVIHDVSDSATSLQVRLVASNGGTAGKVLHATDVVIEAY